MRKAEVIVLFELEKGLKLDTLSPFLFVQSGDVISTRETGK